MRLSYSAAVLIACTGLAACAGDNRQGAAEALRANQATISTTQSTGGGQRALGNTPNVGITTGGGAPVTDRKGAAY